MKAWEETWTAVLWMHDHNQDPLYNVEAGPDDIVADAMGDKGRVDLIEAAPEMARLLIDCQFLSDGCPRCGEFMQSGSDLHKKDCALRAVLVKAGVLEAGHT